MLPVAIQANDILQAAITMLVGLLIFLTLGNRLNIIEWTIIRPKSPNETKSQLKRRINGGGGQSPCCKQIGSGDKNDDRKMIYVSLYFILTSILYDKLDSP